MPGQDSGDNFQGVLFGHAVPVTPPFARTPPLTPQLARASAQRAPYLESSARPLSQRSTSARSGSMPIREANSDSDVSEEEANLLKARYKFQHAYKPGMQEMFKDSTLQRAQAKQRCAYFRQRLLESVINPCRAVATPEVLRSYRAEYAIELEKLSNALLQDVNKPWLSKLDQAIEDLTSDTEGEDSDSPSEDSDGEVGTDSETADEKRAPQQAGTAAFDDGTHEPCDEPPPAYEEALKSPRPGTYEIFSTCAQTLRYAPVDRDISSSKQDEPSSGDVSSDEELDGLMPGAFPLPNTSSPQKQARHNDAGAARTQAPDKSQPHSDTTTTTTKALHQADRPRTGYQAIKPYIRRSSQDEPSPRQRDRRSTQDEAEGESDGEDEAAELQKAFRRLSTGASRRLTGQGDEEVFEGRGQRRR